MGSGAISSKTIARPIVGLLLIAGRRPNNHLVLQLRLHYSVRGTLCRKTGSALFDRVKGAGVHFRCIYIFKSVHILT